MDLHFFARRSYLGAPLLRLFIAAVLIYGTQDNVFSQAQMLEFRDFLARHGFPFPLLSAWVSVYAQFLCGIAIALGLFTRWAALIMVVNFIVALAMVHVGLPFSANIAPLAMLFGSLFLLFHGPGKWSFDEAKERKKAAGVPATA
jgi:putative oxidoreductase